MNKTDIYSQPNLCFLLLTLLEETVQSFQVHEKLRAHSTQYLQQSVETLRCADNTGTHITIPSTCLMNILPKRIVAV